MNSRKRGSDEERDPAEPVAAFGAIGRRRFLRLGLGAAAVAAGGYGLFVGIAGSAPHQPQLRMLGDRRGKTVRAIADTLFPQSPGFMSPAVLDRLVIEFDRFLERLTPDLASQLQLAITYVEFAPVLLDRRLRSFAELDSQAREQHWRDHWELTDDDLRRGIGAAFRRSMSLVCYDSPELWPQIHYPGPVLAAMPGR